MWDDTFRRGWTLVELLVVVAVIGVLISLMLPALGAARGGARALDCKNNLRIINNGWSEQLAEMDNRLPYTNEHYRHPDSNYALNLRFPDMPILSHEIADTFNSCPEVRVQFRFVHYFGGRWGYVVNSWWGYGGDERNNLKPTSEIIHPSKYPYFVDPEVYSWVNGRFKAAKWTPDLTENTQHGGFGPNHGGSESGNTAFADGTVRSVSPAQIHAAATREDPWNWYANR